MRLLAQLRRNTWQCGPLTHVCGAIMRGRTGETADHMMITCSEGSACVWEMKDQTFQILCFLSHMDMNDQHVKVNVAAAIVIEPSAPSDPTTFRIITGGDDGITRLWSFKKDRSGKWSRFADSFAEPYGIPQKIKPEAVLSHKCDTCKHCHAVLTLGIIPMMWEGQSEKVSFNFVGGTTAGFASVFAVVEESGISSMRELESDVKMMHDLDTVVHHASVTTEFLRKSGPQSCLIVTCGGFGMVKLWRISELTEKRCSVEHLISYKHADEAGCSYVLSFVSFTPAFNKEGCKRFLITSSYDDFRHERSRIFAWDPEEDLGVKTEEKVQQSGELVREKPSKEYVFRANNFCFWFPVSLGERAAGGNYVFCLTSAPDKSAKMFRLVNIDRQALTEPLLEESAKRVNERGSTVIADPAEIVHTFQHSGPVRWVTTVRRQVDGPARKFRTVETTGSTDALLQSEEECGSEEDREDRGHWYFVTASTDKVACVWDPASRQQAYSLRAAYMSEMYLPLVMQVLTTMQLMSFSLKQDYSWNKCSMSTTRSFLGVVTINAEALAELLPIREGQAAVLHLASAIFLILAFVFIIVADLHHQERKRMLSLEVSKDFRQEVKDGQTGLRGMPMGPKHMQLDRAAKRRFFCLEMIHLGSTVMVVPVVKALLAFFDCLPQDNVDGTDVMTGQGDWFSCHDKVYMYLRVPVAVFVGLYIFLALPFIVVKGDAKVVAWRDLLCNFRQWRENALQKSSLVHLGVMHVTPIFMFEKLLEMGLKILVPCLSFLIAPPFAEQIRRGRMADVDCFAESAPAEGRTFSHHDRSLLIRACFITALHGLALLQALIWRLYETGSINSLFTGMKVAVFWAGVSSTVTSWYADDELAWPTYLFYAGFVVIVAATIGTYQFLSKAESDEEKKAEADIRLDPTARRDVEHTTLKLTAAMAGMKW